MIKRIAENHILADIKQFPVIGIIGPRQVGKTTLSKSLMNKLDKKAIYLDLELQEDIAKLENAGQLSGWTMECQQLRKIDGIKLSNPEQVSRFP